MKQGELATNFQNEYMNRFPGIRKLVFKDYSMYGALPLALNIDDLDMCSEIDFEFIRL